MIAQILALLVMPIQERFDLSLRTGGVIHSALFDSVVWELAFDAPTARFLAVAIAMRNREIVEKRLGIKLPAYR